MGSSGKKYSKRKLNVLIEAYSTKQSLADAVGLSASTIYSLSTGGTSHTPTHVKLNALYKKVKEETTQQNGVSKAPLPDLLRAIVTKASEPQSSQTEQLKRIEEKLDRLLTAWGV